VRGQLTSATATLTASATDADTYEFFIDGVDQNNGGGDAFQLPSNLATSTLITIQAWDATTSSCYIEYGVNIEQNVIGSGQISGTQVICSNSSPTLLGSLTAATVQPGATLEYYWYSDSDLDGNFDLIPAGPHGASYQPGTLTTSTTFYRVARSTWNGNVCEETSNTVTVTVADVLTAGTATTTIGSALGDNVICSGDTELDIEIDSGEAAAPDIRFIWQTSPDDANWTDTAQTNETFTRGQALFANTYYRRVAQRMSGGVPICSINSASVLVKVNTISAGSLAIAGSTSETICYNTSPSDISFDVAPVAYGGAGTVSYTWYRSDRNATDTGWLAWTEIAGVDSPTLSSATISDLTVSTRFYATVSSTVDTKECTANTNEIIVEVIDEISNPNFSVPATGTVSVCYGESPGPLTFTNADTGGPFISGLGTTFSYSNQWFSSTVSGGPYTTEIAGATALSYTPPALTSDVYYVLRTTYTDNNGLSCTSTSTRMISVLIDDLPSAPGVTILMPGTTTPTLVAQNQVNRITIGGAPAAAEEYYAVVNGILNTFTAADGNVSNIATGLAAEIDNDANISAVANGVGGAGTIEVTGDTPGDVVTISVSRSSGAGGLITSQLITGSQVITLCAGELTSATATLTASATDADTYEFFIDGVDQNNGGGDAFQLPSNLATSTLITIQAWDATTSSCYIEYGVNIEQNVIGSGQISGTQVICSNSSPTLLGSLTAATVQPGATLEYYWYSDSDLDGNFDLIPAGPHGASYQPGTLTTSTTFYRVARSTWNGNVCEETSNTVTVTVADVLTAGTATTTIGSTLGDNVICSGDTELDIEIDSGEAAAPDIRFIWQTSPDDANWTDTAQTNETFTRGKLYLLTLIIEE
jgi:hypothetical protein